MVELVEGPGRRVHWRIGSQNITEETKGIGGAGRSHCRGTCLKVSLRRGDSLDGRRAEPSERSNPA